MVATMKSKKFSEPTTTFRIRKSAIETIRIAAKRKGQSIRIFIERAALAAAARPTKLTRTGEF